MIILGLIYCTSSLLKRHLVYMLVQDELTTREQAIHQIKLIYAAGRLVAVMVIVSSRV